MAEVSKLMRSRRFLGPLITAAAGIVAALVLQRCLAGRGDGWAFAKLGLALGLMVALLREKLDVGATLLVGTASIGAAFGVAWADMARVATFGVFDRAAAGLHDDGMGMIRLVLMVFLINFMGQALMLTGGLKRLIGSMERLFRDVRWVMAGVPSIIGLLPMPGGAMLSAPMVGEMGETLDIGPDEKTAANYWFRHVWEWWWPIYPAILIMLEQKYATLGDIIVYQAPLSLVAIAAGWFFVLRKIPRRRPQPGEWRLAREAGSAIGVLWPVLFVVLVMLTFRPPKPWGDWVLPAALVAADAALVLTRRMKRPELLKALKAAASWQMSFLIFGVCVLRGMFGVSGAAERLPAALAAVHVPAMVACFVAPFTVNVIVGYNLAGVSMTFPLLAGLFEQTGAAGVAVAYAGSYLGMMSSPVHLCLALTREYFRTPWARAYAALAPMLAVEIVAVALIGWLG